MKEEYKVYFRWGLTAFAVICSVLVFYDTLFLNSVLFDYLRKLVSNRRTCKSSNNNSWIL